MSGVPPGVVPGGNPGLVRPPMFGGPPGPMPPGGPQGGALAGSLAAALAARAAGGGAPGGMPQPQPGPGPAPLGAGRVAPVPAAPMMPGGAPAPVAPGMVLNPAFAQWQQLSQAWHAETQRREDEFLSACVTIRADVIDGYRIDIEADSTIAPDEQAEKQSRTEFLQAIVPMLQLLIPEAQQNPGAVPLVRALVMFGVRSFPAARSLEEQFEQAFRQLFQSPPPPPEQKGGNVKSPVEIASEERIAQGEQAVDMQGNQIKAAQVQVAAQKNAIQLYQANLQAQNEQRQQNQEVTLRTAELSANQQEMADRHQLEQARLSHLVTRDTAGMV